MPAGDAAALAAALAELLADPALRAAMGEHNRRLVEERYAWSRVGDRLEGVYGEATRLCLTALVVVRQHLAADEPEDHPVAAVERVAGGQQHEQQHEHREQQQPQLLRRERELARPSTRPAR